MFTLIKRSLEAISDKFRRQHQPVELMKEKWIADFSSPFKSCFDIKPENSYNAYLDKGPSSKEGARSKEKTGSLFLGMKKKNCMAWLETADRVYENQVINASFRFHCPIEDCCAVGIMFRVGEQGTYYLAQVSNKGFFRFDVLNNSNPKPLVDWIEIPSWNWRGTSKEILLSVIAYGDHFILFIDDKWIAETHDSSISGGHLGFALVSYETDENVEMMDTPPELLSPADNEGYTCRAWLDYLSVDSRAVEVETVYKQWRDSLEISAKNRLCLAESFIAIEQFHAAYDQVLKAWKTREEAAKSVTATYTETRAKGELLFAAQIAMQIGKIADAENYINVCLAIDKSNLDALDKKVKILIAQERYGDLVNFLPKYINILEAGSKQTEASSFYDLLGHTCLKLKDYKTAATAWDKAFGLNNNNALYAINAADACEMMGENEEAVKHRLDAGKCFLRQKNYTEMEPLVIKLLETRNENAEVHRLAGKWAFAIGNHKQAEAELAFANKLKRKSKPVKARKTSDKTKSKKANKNNPAKIKTPAVKEAARRANKPVQVMKKPRSKTKK
jgi:tetratricopeptide (TPR) repeat protein